MRQEPHPGQCEILFPNSIGLPNLTVVHAEVLELHDEVLEFRDEVLEYRDEALEFRDEALDFLDEGIECGSHASLSPPTNYPSMIKFIKYKISPLTFSLSREGRRC